MHATTVLFPQEPDLISYYCHTSVRDSLCDRAHSLQNYKDPAHDTQAALKNAGFLHTETWSLSGQDGSSLLPPDNKSSCSSPIRAALHSCNHDAPGRCSCRSLSSHSCVGYVLAVRVAEPPKRGRVQGGDKDRIGDATHRCATVSGRCRLGLRSCGHGLEGSVQAHG